MDRYGTITAGQDANIMNGAASVLCCLHRDNILHRNVLFGSIMLFSNGSIKLLDFKAEDPIKQLLAKLFDN